MSKEATSTKERSAASAAEAPQATPKKGNKPIGVVRDKGCSISVFRNERTVEGQTKTVYKFTFARTYKKGEEFVTTYAFRIADLFTLQHLIDDAQELVHEQEAPASSESDEE